MTFDRIESRAASGDFDCPPLWANWALYHTRMVHRLVYCDLCDGGTVAVEGHGSRGWNIIRTSHRVKAHEIVDVADIPNVHQAEALVG